MSTPIKNAIIIGAGGNLGSVAIQAFLKSNLNVSVLTREGSTSTFPPQVKVIKTDYSKDSLLSALKGQDAVVSFIATAGLASQADLIDAAAEVGVKRFLPSEFGHNTASKQVVAVVPLFTGKVKIVEQLKAQSNLTWTGVVTGMFFDFGFARGLLGIDAKAGKASIWDKGDVPFSTTNISLIGQTIVKLLTDPAAYEDSKNKYIYVASHTTTQQELLAATEKATGKKLEVNTINSAELISSSSEKLANGDRSVILRLLQSIGLARYDGVALADFRPFGIFNEKHGITDVSVEEDVKKLVSK